MQVSGQYEQTNTIFICAYKSSKRMYIILLVVNTDTRSEVFTLWNSFSPTGNQKIAPGFLESITHLQLAHHLIKIYDLEKYLTYNLF